MQSNIFIFCVRSSSCSDTLCVNRFSGGSHSVPVARPFTLTQEFRQGCLAMLVIETTPLSVYICIDHTSLCVCILRPHPYCMRTETTPLCVYRDHTPICVYRDHTPMGVCIQRPHPYLCVHNDHTPLYVYRDHTPLCVCTIMFSLTSGDLVCMLTNG